MSDTANSLTPDEAPKASVVNNIIYASSQAEANEAQGATKIALTDSQPLQQHLRRTGQTNAEAYEWHITKLPDDQIVPASRVRQLAMRLFLDVVKSRADAAHREWTDEQHREFVLRASDDYQRLSQTHPRLVLMLCAHDFSSKKLQHLLELIELRERHETQNLSQTQRQEQVSAYFRANFVREAKPGEEEEAVRNGTGLRGTLVTKEQMEADTK